MCCVSSGFLKTRSDLEAREREAEARAKMVAHKAQARTVQSLRADNIALMEKINAEIAASKASAVAGSWRRAFPSLLSPIGFTCILVLGVSCRCHRFNDGS